mmetsp:Transcript_42531/g.99780  ORF Transcript_42531/g.99780 Transcript_42531/m.99780 type:complete len:329 (+) Transcript_42531:3-989(+)
MSRIRMDEGLLLFDRDEHSFAIVSDMDRSSRDPERFVWRSLLRRGTLLQMRNGRYRIRWGDELLLQSNTAKHNRSMELSELVLFGHKLLAMCDYTGLIFKIDTNDIAAGKKPKVLQRWAIADGDGNSVKPCKMEWATVKDGELFVGSVGKEWTSNDGSTIEHRDPEWVKTIGQNGRVRNINWGPVYGAIRKATNTSLATGGWLWHEAVHWDPRSRRWFFLPRKESQDVAYIPGQNEARCSNLLITVSEDFQDIKVTRIGPLEPKRGFTALRKVPGTADVFMALKVKEADGEMKTWATVFNLNGDLLLEPDPFEFVADVKYEGLEFFPW